MKSNGWEGVSDNGLYVSLRSIPGGFEEEGALCHTIGRDYYCKSKVIIKSNDYGKLYLSFYNPTDERLTAFFEKCPEIMLTEGIVSADYKTYINDFTSILLTISDDNNSMTVIPDDAGNAGFISSFAPKMNICSNSDSIIINCNYNVDTKLYIDNKIAEMTK